ncbi:MAG: 2-amino-4-hydroxy-6-hydroxymethyldihydropteridine diphosphokinase [Actinobacteria bacterium]|nr:2-amino-4-hydroxy-6-hydroxymethyldihydropteridine diphosphokinase [Actinomycetota bacterium]
MGERALLGLGSNLGERLANLQRAADLLGAAVGVRVVASSRIYETEPVGGPAQPDFLNAVVEVETDLEPRELLAACLGVEQDLGRVREERWGPRVIDVDLLLYDEVDMDEPHLIVPHPRLHERAFALVPLLELVPDPVLAGGMRAADATPGGEVRLWGPPLLVRR